MQVPSPSAREAASMYGTAVAVFLVILVAALQGSAPPESPFPYRIPLDPEGTLELSWNVSYAQETVHFQLLVRRLEAGVLFGMSDRGEMENADLAVLWTDGGSAYFGVSLCGTPSLPPPSLPAGRPAALRLLSPVPQARPLAGRERSGCSRGPLAAPPGAEPQGRTGSRMSASPRRPPGCRPRVLRSTSRAGGPPRPRTCPGRALAGLGLRGQGHRAGGPTGGALDPGRGAAAVVAGGGEEGGGFLWN